MKNSFDAHATRVDITFENPTSPDNAKVIIRDNGKGMNEEAVEMYNRALKINPKHIEAYNNLGVLYFNTGEEEKALTALNKAIRIKPDYFSDEGSFRIVQ